MVGAAAGALAFALLTQFWWRAGATSFFGLDVTGPVLLGAASSTMATALRNAALLAFFFVGHSLTASLRAKALTRLSPRTHRQLYLVWTLASLALVSALWTPLVEPVLWHLEGAAALALRAVQLAGLAGLLWTGRHFELRDFFGLPAAAGRAPGELTFSGPFALVRHPSYFFLLLLLADPAMPLGRALVAAGVVLYIAIGSRIEERKLLREQGPAYAAYRARTPWLIPSPRSVLKAFRTYN